MSKHICPNGCKDGFFTTAHIMQEWKVDEEGNFIELEQDCLEVTSSPQDENIWTCAKSSNDSILVIYESGKPKQKFNNVIAESLFLHEDYHNSQEHLLEFKTKSGDLADKKTCQITSRNSFSVFPSWMKDKLERKI